MTDGFGREGRRRTAWRGAGLRPAPGPMAKSDTGYGLFPSNEEKNMKYHCKIDVAILAYILQSGEMIGECHE